MSADLASFCGVVDNTNGQGKISTSFYGFIKVASGQQLDCSGLVSFGIQFGGRSTEVSAWVFLSIRGEILLSWQTLGELGIIPEAFPMSPLEGGLLPSDEDTDVVEVLTPKKMPEVIDLVTSDPGEEDEDKTGDPDKIPGEGAVPFNFGWRREVVFRQARQAGVPNCDIYYIPPQDGRYRTRKAQQNDIPKRI